MGKGRLTVLTATCPTVLGKSYRLGAEGLEKTIAGEVREGAVAVTEFSSASELAMILRSIQTNQAILSSLPKAGVMSARLVTKAALAEHPGALTRTKEDFSFPHAQRGIVVLDYDPPLDALPFNPEQLWALVCSIAPKLGQSGAVWWCSGSSFIYNGDAEVQGLRGQRLYLLVSDLSDSVRVGEVLAKRLWLAGHGYIAISASGQKLVRTVFDAAMFQPARLDFIGGSVCTPPLAQRRGTPIVLSDGEWFDTRREFPDLSLEEEGLYESLVEAAKLKAETASRKAREAWKSARMEQATLRLTGMGVPANHATDRVERTLSAALGGILLGDFVLTLKDRRTVTVGEVLDNYERYHGALTLDPLEPEYSGYKVVGKLFLWGARPVLHSFAHGGATFRLMRQPSRLYVERGRKSELADQILAILQNEPDVFLRGGFLVTIADGRVRPLRKHALMYLIGSRAAFYSRGEKGHDIPVDVPSDVVDMVCAAVEG